MFGVHDLSFAVRPQRSHLSGVTWQIGDRFLPKEVAGKKAGLAKSQYVATNPPKHAESSFDIGQALFCSSDLVRGGFVGFKDSRVLQPGSWRINTPNWH